MARTEVVGRRYLLVVVEGEGRMALSPERVHAIGTARIEGRLRSPYLIVDLFLDPLLPAVSQVPPEGDKRGIAPEGDKRGIAPEGDKREVCVVRFAASLSAPSESVDVFGCLVRHVVEASRCRLFPRQDLGKFLAYSSEADYEQAVLTEMSGGLIKSGERSDA